MNKLFFTIFLITMLLAATPVTNSCAESFVDANSVAGMTNRVVKIFDFNERPFGNLENLPMHWQKVTLSGFPHFVNGQLDDLIGDPKPSFKLLLDGGNLGYLYTVRQIPAFPGSDHKIILSFKTKKMHHSRGYVQAFYMDRYGHLLKDTVHYSPLIEPDKFNTSNWQNLSMELPFSNPEGRFIGIGLFLVQQDQMPTCYESPLKSYRKDIDAELFFDNITILRLPKTRLKLQKNHPIYTSEEDVVVETMIADAVSEDLCANLVITDLAYGEQKRIKQQIAILPPIEAILQGNAKPPAMISHKLGKLPPGLYKLSLEVYSDSNLIINKKINIAVLNHSRQNNDSKDFGIDLNECPLTANKEVAQFVSALNPKWITLPLWRKDLPIRHSKSKPSPSDEFILNLNNRKIKIVGSWLEVPTSLVARTNLLNPSIWDFLAGKKSWWQSEFSIVLSRHADRIDHWIFGQSKGCWEEPDPRMGFVLDTLQKEFSNFQGQFTFLTAWPSMLPAPDHKTDAGYFIKVPCELMPSSFDNYFSPWLAKNQFNNDQATGKTTELWAVLESQNLDVFQQTPATIDFTNRFINAKKSGLQQIAAENLWSNSRTTTGTNLEPNAYYVAYANIIDQLSGLDYVGEIQVDEDRKGELFASSRRAVLVLRNTKQKPYVSKVNLGDNLRACDMWGKEISIKTDNEKWELPYYPIIFVKNISPGLARFIASIKFDPETIPSRFGLQNLKLTFQNTFEQSVSGRVKLYGSGQWLFDPSAAHFTLTDNQNFSLPMKLRYPSNEPIGKKIIQLKFELEARRPITLNLLLPLQLGNSDLKMRVLWFRRNDEMILWQEIINTGEHWANLIGYVMTTNQPRQERQIRQLGPNQNAIKEYSLGPWEEMLGQTIRVGFREIRGTRIANEVITLE